MCTHGFSIIHVHMQGCKYQLSPYIPASHHPFHPPSLPILSIDILFCIQALPLCHMVAGDVTLFSTVFGTCKSPVPIICIDDVHQVTLLKAEAIFCVIIIIILCHKHRILAGWLRWWVCVCHNISRWRRSNHRLIFLTGKSLF